LNINFSIFCFVFQLNFGDFNMSKSLRNWRFIAAFAVIPLSLLGESKGDVLFNNGPLVTHAGQGPGGVDVSMASVTPNATGSNVTATLWRADNFSVGGQGWFIDSIQTYAYDTNFADPRFGEAIIRIHANDGENGSPGTILASSNATWQLAGINRVFNGAANIGNTARQLQLLTANFGGLSLAAGDYYFSFSVSNTNVTATNNWFPYVMDINPNDPNDPITRIGNAYSSGNLGASWTISTLATGGWNQAVEIPFIISGTAAIPEPNTFLLLMLGTASVMFRRKK
jgi:hypothetical protein